MPVIRMQQGEVQRWRCINSGFFQELPLAIERHDQYLIAIDGIMFKQTEIFPMGKPITLSPGNRAESW